jgi:2-desacetyl-2-hydroxyethyl bacteriochlorophyllide A dehydrogenase
MKAAVFRGPRDIRVEEVAEPKLGTGDVLLKVQACGICGSDLHTYQHGMFEDLGLVVETGRVLGHELSGEVVDVKGEVPGVRIGDRVCAVGTGGNAEYLLIPAVLTSIISPVPADLSYEEAATAEPLATSLHAVNLAKPTDGETHVIIGAGIIGLGVLQVLKAIANVKTVVIDLSEKRLGMAQALGADTTINAAKEDAFQKVVELTGAEEVSFMPMPTGMADAVYDCAGLPLAFAGTPVLQQAIAMVKQNGKVVVVAIFEKPAEIDHNLLVRKGITLFGSWAWTLDELHRSLEMMGSRDIDRKPLITHQFPLDRAREAYETQLKADEAVKVMIRPFLDHS